MVDTSDEGRVLISDVPVVRESLDVFLKDLPGMPIMRKMEFRIDLTLNTTPIAKASYRLARLEVQELTS